MLNYVWLALIAVAVLLGGVTGHLQDVGDQAIEGTNTALGLAAKLFAIMVLWLGLMRLADRAGLVHRLGLALKPVMIWLFPEVPADHPAMGAIIMNMAANILGLNNAATPLGLRAMNELESLNRRPGIATNAMCMLLAINTSSITLIPGERPRPFWPLAHGIDPDRHHRHVTGRDRHRPRLRPSPPVKILERSAVLSPAAGSRRRMQVAGARRK